MISVLLTIFLISYSATNAEDVVVNISGGPVQGRTETTVSGVTFFSFEGIPFAEPPVGELRFQAPVPKRPWNGVINATYERGCCFQMTLDRPEETEDCLYINVYSPVNPTANGSIAVMIMIYGGGFIEGYSERINFGPEHLMEHDVVLVSFNYRVGPFGFFSTGDDVIPGNAGLKDQSLAIKWTKENIAFFGGDPNKITIFGQSAGAASVVYHTLSPLSKGLFRAAICESASALSPWAYQRSIKEVSYYLATLLNEDYGQREVNSTEILNFLKSLPAKDIDNASLIIDKMESPLYNQIQQGFFFTPTIEQEHEGAFLTKSMFELLESGDINNVPLMIGVNTEECLFYIDDEKVWNNYTTYFDGDLSLLIPYDMNIQSEDDKLNVSNLIKQFYSPTGNFSDNPRNLIKYFSDQAFARSIIKHAQLQAKYGDLYFYEFGYHGVLGGQTTESVKGFSEDVRHGEELSYIMTRSYGGLNTTDLSKYPEADQLVQKRFITLLTNFAKYLNPTPQTNELFQNLTWPKVVPNNFQYLKIGSDLEITTNPKNVTFTFWEGIFAKYGVPPYTTY